MPDICLCTGNCLIKENCYRYTATANPYAQTYSSLEPICIPNGYSEYIPNERNKDVKIFRKEDYK